MTTVGLVQVSWDLNWSHSEHDAAEGKNAYSLLPYSAGMLQAYASSVLPPGSVSFVPPLFSRQPISEMADALQGCDVVACSCYIWDIEATLALAAELKRRRPEIVVVLGGPQVPDHAEAWLRSRPQVDLVCHGEGEEVFAEVLARLPNRDLADVAGVSYLDAKGRFTTSAPRPRCTDLDRFPSPYLSGVFDSLMEAHPGKRWVATWETNRGCPFSCTFCDWGSATASRVYRFSMERLAAEVEWFSSHQIGFILCCDANFGMLPRDLEITQMVVDAKVRTGFPFSMSIQNAKNATQRSYEVQRLLNDNLHTIGVTLSLQSADPKTLANIRRSNIKSSSFTELQRRFSADGIYTYTDLIIGLPGEAYDAFADSISAVVRDGQHNHIQFHNCSVLPNAEMGDPAYQRRFGMKTVAQPIRGVYSEAADTPEVEEYLDTVVATDAMPPEDWVRAKVLAWMVDLCYFDRILQIPLLVAQKCFGWPLRRGLECLIAAGDGRFPVLGHVVTTLAGKARGIQRGELEFFTGEDGLLWPADQHVFLSLLRAQRFEAFYKEAGRALGELLTGAGEAEVGAGHGPLDDDGREGVLLLDEALRANQALLRLPGRGEDGRLVLSHDVIGFWQAMLRGEQVALEPKLVAYRVCQSERRFDDMASFAEFLTWCQGRDKREYLARALPLRAAASHAS